LGSDRNAAKRAAPEIIARFYRQIDEAKAQIAGAKPTLRTAAKSHYAAELRADDRERLSGMGDSLRTTTASLLAAKLSAHRDGVLV